MWLSAEETTVFDNALVVIGHLYRTGRVHIRLGRLLHEQSSLEINYFIDKNQSQISNSDVTTKEREKSELSSTKIVLTASEIDEHKRQLTFCNVDLPNNMPHMKILLEEQLKLLQTIGGIYSTFIQLETIGHPNYQLKDEQYKIYDGNSKTLYISSKVLFYELFCFNQM